MRKDLKDYYGNYYKDHGDGSYVMEQQRDSSRVKTFKDWIKEFAKPGDKILDVGCGDTYLARELPDYDWYGIDLNTEKATHKQVVSHDLMTTPYPYEPRTFDIVMCSEVLEHLWDLRVVHREVRRVLKDTGTYFLSTPNYDHIDHFLMQFRQLEFNPAHPHLFEHIRQYTLSSHAKFLEETGWKIDRYTGADAHYSEFFVEARNTLMEVLKGLGHNVDTAFVDQVIGAMFKAYSHTIVIGATKHK